MRIQLQVTIDLRTARRVELRLKKLYHSSNHFIHLHTLQLWLRHLRELAELADDPLKIRDLRQQCSRTSAKYFVELLRSLLPCPHEILHCKLQRKQRILQFVRQSPRQLAPGCNPLGLQQPFSLSEQLGGHSIERIGQLPQFIVAQHIDSDVPISSSNF